MLTWVDNSQLCGFNMILFNFTLQSLCCYALLGKLVDSIKMINLTLPWTPQSVIIILGHYSFMLLGSTLMESGYTRLLLSFGDMKLTADWSV